MKRTGSARKTSRSNGSSTRDKSSRTRYALCIRNDDNPASLERCKVYRTLPDPKAAKHGLVRVIDESGEDYLYPRDWFVAVDVPAAARPAFA